MTTWTSEELAKIGNADELEIASVREDGTVRKSVPIWVVRVGDDLYVRSANGLTAGWYRGTQVRHEGHIRAGGVSKDVTFVDINADDPIHSQIDEAYRAKYRRYDARYVDPMVTPAMRSVTIKLALRA
jgi:hypothetical protein